MAQGTIKSFDETNKTGFILDDAAEEFAFDHAAFQNTGVRLFRIGQRVKWRVDGEKIVDLTLVTLPN